MIKLTLLPYAQEVDADAISRTYLSLQFANNPHIIETGNWPPLFFYIMGGSLKIYPNQFFTPVFVNIILSIGLLFPLFFLLKRIFDEKIAFLLCVFFSFSPIVFQMNLLGMSELIHQNANLNSGLICDFWNWETTYYIPFSAGLAEDNFQINGNEDNGESITTKTPKVIDRFDKSVILVNKSRLMHELLIECQNTFQLGNGNDILQLETSYENESIICYAYKASDD